MPAITVNVTIDESALALGNRVDAVLMAAMQDGTDWARGEWARVAGTKLKTTAAQYQDGLVQPGSIVVPHETPTGVASAVVLVGAFPNMLERGAPAWDLKIAALASPKAKTSKGGARRDGTIKPAGRYISIPFRHRVTSNTSGVAVGGALAPLDVRKAMQLVPRSGPGRKIALASYNAKVTALYPPQTKPQIGGMTGPYTHTASIYAGMTRVGAKGQGQAMTFRTISTNSPQSSWWHPGLHGIEAAKEAAPAIERAVSAFIGAAIDAAVK